MKRARTVPTGRASVGAQNVVRELCDSIDAATRGDPARAGSEIRHAVTRGVKLFMAGAIDSRGASLINGAAAKAHKAMRARTRGAHVLVTSRQPVDNHRRIDLSTSIALPPDQFRSDEDAQFDALLESLTSGEWPHPKRSPAG